MDPFQRKLLQTLVREYDELSEVQKQTGVEDRVLARQLSSELGIESSFVYGPEYQGSEAFFKVLNALQYLEELNLVSRRSTISIGWTSPKRGGRDLVRQWAEEQRSPVFQGKRVVKYLCELQQNISPVHRRVGKAGFVDVEKLCSDLEIDMETYVKATRWGERQGYVAEPSIEQYSVENGGIYITDEGMNAVDGDFKMQQPVAGPTINIHDSLVYGSIVAAGRDAMAITSPALAQSVEEIRSLLGVIQAAAETLPEDSDERHDALQELESLQREFSKDAPLRGRIERSVNLIGSLASIGTVAAPQVARLLELVQQLPGL